MQSLILEIQDKMAVYAKHARSNRDAVEAIEKLKQLSERVQDLEFQLEVAEKAIAHG